LNGKYLLELAMALLPHATPKPVAATFTLTGHPFKIQGFHPYNFESFREFYSQLLMPLLPPSRYLPV
jgi:hypothetical protein